MGVVLYGGAFDPPHLGHAAVADAARERFGVEQLDRQSPELRACLEHEAARARELLLAGRVFRERVPGRIGRGVWLFARGGLAALAALDRADWDIFGGRPRPSRARLALEVLRT